MVAVDIKMPKGCHDCKFCHGFTFWNCILSDKIIDNKCINPYSQRPDWCELLYMPPTVTRNKSNEELDAEMKAKVARKPVVFDFFCSDCGSQLETPEIETSISVRTLESSEPVEKVLKLNTQKYCKVCGAELDWEIALTGEEV